MIHLISNKNFIYTHKYLMIIIILLEQNISFEQTESVTVIDRYKDLFKVIVNDTIKSISEYSTIK